MIRTSDFDYDLPEGLIASRPLADRAGSRMMLVERGSGRVSHHDFRDFVGVCAGDYELVLNDTKVVPARFFSDDGRVEMVRTGVGDDGGWWCLVRPGRRMRVGREVVVGGCVGVVVEVDGRGERLIRWEVAPDLEKVGQLALPHYMGRVGDDEDGERYQTVYAREEGAIAAPTAGLHFTPEVLASFDPVYVTLHVGVGTFRPVKVEDAGEHVMHSERYFLGEGAAERISNAGRVLSVGTTVTRVLEHVGRGGGALVGGGGETDIFIYPPYEFQVVDALLTNFHLPRSTLLMLVSAFGGRELMLEAYAKAVEERYRFYSYGDCMLIL